MNIPDEAAIKAHDAAFVGSLCYRCPDLRQLLAEHLSTFNCLLPHLLMGDITRWAVARFEADSEDRALKMVLTFIADDFEHSPEMHRNLIYVSFLENLSSEGVEGRLRDCLPTVLQQAY